MFAFVILITAIGMFMLGRWVGRAESMQSMLKYLTNVHAELSMEDKLMFEKYFNDYKQKYYPER